MRETKKWKILAVDDDRQSRQSMVDWLEAEGFDVVTAGDGKAALKHLHNGIAVIVTDLKMPNMDGLELLRHCKKQAPQAAVILITGYGTVPTAVAALKQGAFDYLTKPVNPKALSECIRAALSEKRAAANLAELQANLKEGKGFEKMVGASAAMDAVFKKIRKAADARSTVLVYGESGTGKELVVRALHYASKRRSKPFVPVNCAAIPESLLESELFGHEKGAFTGATGRRIGLFEAADGGTLFIDEIGEMNIGLQSKLLRAIETHQIMPVGSNKQIEIDIRLVAATSRNLKEEVKKKAFREDLYYRLKVVEIDLPPLRERTEDIPLLVAFFLQEISAENHQPAPAISPEAMDVLMSYPWPGNVRELRNTLEGSIVLSGRSQLEVSDLPAHLRGGASAQIVMRSGMTLAELEKDALARTLEAVKGRRAEAAKILGLSVRALQRKVQEHDLPY